ncbi:CmpA/NrtA family ABC transporter substrate-binding protein [uncultured Deinococcus sp.]|uniref:CmpA/NrtA family ABC transporter substrate-binding protein n=1 Tax=uncultured Deinococcus sp. TaxID=158789 RepID=UPI0025FDB5DE|nr:CmpA/NrtA family ABC transporter substrate-binding protein [uncultured Deinococcus sp.]
MSDRRTFLKLAAKTAAVTAASTMLPRFNIASAQSRPINIGFIPLTDCASVVMAQELGYFKKYGVTVNILKQASWANTRDSLLSGDLHAAHCLFSLPLSVYSGIGGPAGRELPIAMVINNNGQAITLENTFKAAGGDPKAAGEIIRKLIAQGKAPTFAMTFPGGTHDIWLRYWLAHAGVPQGKVGIITVPPPQMVANMKVGNMDGFCVGEPWGGVAVEQGIGFTHVTTQQMWRNHPEKALVLNKEFSARKDEVKAVMRAVLDASAWLDSLPNRRQAAKVISASRYVNAPADVIQDRLEGKYEMGGSIGTRQFLGDQMMFSRSGQTSMPRHAHAMWFLAQYARFGLVKQAPDYEAVADRLLMTDLYREVAKEAGLKLPTDDMAKIKTTLDGLTFDPKRPADFVRAHPIPV